MKCRECDACVKQGNEYVCIGVKEPFVIDNIEMECSEYPNFSQSGTMYSINEDGTLGEKIGTCDMLKGKINMKHKYLQELYPDGKLPFPYGEEDYHDFDERDTFNMDYTLAAWLYECLRYFQERVSKIINLDFHKFYIDNETLTQSQCIERMIEDCKTILLMEEFTDEEYDEMLNDSEKLMSKYQKREKQADAAKDDLFKVLSNVHWAMWW